MRDARGSPSTPLCVGVIGGEGQMGRWLRAFWEGLGYPVVFSDRATQAGNADVVRVASIVFVSVPLRSTPDVLESLLPDLQSDQALVSIASLMEPSAAVLARSPSEALCAHPVFGPTVRELQGLPVAIASVRGSVWCEWLAGTLAQPGLRVLRTTPAEHDAKMAVVQALLHSLYVALCATMQDAGLPPSDALDWASPTLRLQLGLIARILGQDADLYADLVVGNPLTPSRLELLAAYLQRLADLARDGDRAGFAGAFLEARAGFGDAGGDLASQAEQALEHFS